MKGLLKYNSSWWVSHRPINKLTGKEIEVSLPLHPDSARMYENEYVYYKFGTKTVEINFDIVNDETIDGKTIVWAKIV